jgi:hypothetical protein
VLTFDGDSDPDMTKVVPARIAAAMYASDLTSDDTIGGHGDTGAYGYSNQPWGGWTLENDPTVHGEVISPILSDTLDSWRSLRMACRHITDHGGGASAETGSHVTVSAVDFVDSPDKVNRLIGVLRHYQRDLYLMGDAGHGRESRENQGYARPFTDPPPLGFLNVDEIQETRAIQHGQSHPHPLRHRIPRVRGQCADRVPVVGRIDGTGPHPSPNQGVRRAVGPRFRRRSHQRHQC